jgi:hypothetical protein
VVGRYDYLSIRFFFDNFFLDTIYRRYKTKKLHYGHLHNCRYRKVFCTKNFTVPNCLCMCKQNIKKEGIFVQIMLLLFHKLLVELKKEYAIFLSLCILSLK